MERERVTVQEAARQLGITESAVRKRAQREQLRSVKVTEGKKERLYIFLDTDEDKFPEPFRERYMRSLEDRVKTLEDEVYRQQAIILSMSQSMQALTGAPEAPETPEESEPQSTTTEEPQEASEAAETVEEASEEAEPRSTTGGAQEGTEYPQRRGGWLAPVDKLPWWHYAIGLFLGFLAGFLAALVIEATILPSSLPTFEFLLVIIAITAVTVWWPTTMFGLWVGYRKRHLRLWSQVLPLGVLVGGVTVLGVGVASVGLTVELLHLLFSFYSLEFLIIVLPACLLFVSAALIGNAWQRRRIGRVFGTTPGSPISRATQGAGQQPRRDLTPTRQAMLGWGGAIISALISLVGTIITAMMMSGS